MLAREPSTQLPWQGPFSGAGKESQSVKILANNNNIKKNIAMVTSTLASVPPLYDLGLLSAQGGVAIRRENMKIKLFGER